MSRPLPWQQNGHANFTPPPIGHNQPPVDDDVPVAPHAPIELARITVAALSSFMADHPVITDEDEAVTAKALVDRATDALKAVEAERDAKVRPLNAQVQQINGEYKKHHNTDAKKPGTFDKVLLELKARLSAFMIAEEIKRAEIARAERAAADEAERIAREAEAQETEALLEAQNGVIGVDIASATFNADIAFSTFERQSRFAASAEKDAHVKGLRTKETLIVTDALKLLQAVGVTAKIEEALLSAAREYRKEFGELPSGVRAELSRGI